MANTSILERLLIEITADDRNLNRALASVERNTQRTGRNAERNLQGIGRNLQELGGLPSLLGAGGLVYGLTRLANESHRAEAATRIFERQTARSGVAYETAAAAVGRLSGTFGVLDTDIQGSSALLLRAGVPLETIESLLKSAGASALNTGADVTTAFQNIALGVAQGRSEIVESSGVVANASQAWAEYAKANGKSVESLTQTEKAVAFANAIIAESAHEVEDLDLQLQGLPRTSAAVSREFATMRRSIGETVTGGLIPAGNALVTVLGFVNNLPAPLRETGTAFVVAGAGATALAVGVGALSLVLGPLVGPAGLLILAAAAAAALVTSVHQAPEPVRTMEQALKDLKAANEGLETAVTNASEAEQEAARQRLIAAQATAQAALEAGRANLQAAQGRLSGAEAAASMNPEGYAAVAATLTRDVQTFETAVAALEAGVISADTALATFDAKVKKAKADGTYKPGGVAPPSPAAQPPPAAGTDAPRTVRDVFTDLDREGTIASQRAAAIGTVEAQVESLEERARLADRALTEVLELGGSAAEVNYLVGRLEALNTELVALGEKPLDIDVSATVAEAMPRPDVVADVAGEVAIPDPGASALVSGQAYEAQRLLEALREGYRDADALAATFGSGEVQRQAALQEKIALTQGAIQSMVQELDFSPASSEVQALVDYLTALEERLRSISDIDMPVPDVTASYDGTRYIPDPGASAEVTDAVPIPMPDVTGDLTDAYKETVAAEKGIYDEFLGSLEGIFSSFAGDLGRALATGDFSGVDAGQAVGGLAGAGATYGLNLLAPGLGTVIGPMIGSFVGGLFGGGEGDADSRAGAEIERRGGASEVNVNIYATQNNSFSGGLDQAKNENALNRQVRRIVEDVLRQADFSRVKKKATA